MISKMLRIKLIIFRMNGQIQSTMISADINAMSGVDSGLKQRFIEELGVHDSQHNARYESENDVIMGRE